MEILLFINFFRSFFDKISADALFITSILWLSIFIFYDIFLRIENSNNTYLTKHKAYVKNTYIIALFILSFLIIKMNIKKSFTEEYLNIFQHILNN